MKQHVPAILCIFLIASTLAGQGTIRTVVGTGIAGFSGDGGPATAAQLNRPTGLAFDSAGNLYIADLNNMRVRKVSPAGIITTVAGNGLGDFTAEHGRATNESLWLPSHVAVDSAGNLYISDDGNNRVRKVSPSGMMTTVAGGGNCCGLGDGGPATRANLDPGGLAIDTGGNLFISDTGHNRVRKVDLRGQIDTFAGYGGDGTATNGPLAKNAALGGPGGLAFDSAGNLFVTTQQIVRKITPDGTITTVAGGGSARFQVGGVPATSISMDPHHLAADSGGGIWVSTDDRVFLVTPSGILYWLAGGAYPSDPNGEGIPSGNAALAVSGIAVDRAGNVYISEASRNRVRKITQ